MGAEGCVLLLVPMLLALAAAALLCWVFKQKEPRQTAAPPCIGGWIPWIRASIRFGKAPLEFIEQARAEYGAVFTVVAAGKRLTFITEEEDFEIFFRSKNVDFQEAVQEPVWHTASISRKSFYKSHTAVHDMLKGRLAPSRLHLFSANLSKEFCEHLMYLGTRGTDNLYDLIWHSMYPAVVNNLFGRGICPTDRNTVREFEDHFQKFDRDFEFGSQLPEFLLRDWAKSKHWLLSLFERIVAKVEKMKPVDDSSKTLLQHLLDTLNGNSTANYSLLMLWASQANALPITFWTLAFIISNPIVYQTVMKELCSVFGDQGNKKIQPEESDLQKLSYLKCCILEAIRLRAPGVITRKVVQPLKIKAGFKLLQPDFNLGTEVNQTSLWQGEAQETLTPLLISTGPNSLLLKTIGKRQVVGGRLGSRHQGPKQSSLASRTTLFLLETCSCCQFTGHTGIPSISLNLKSFFLNSAEKCCLPAGPLEEGRYRKTSLFGWLHGFWRRQISVSRKMVCTAGNSNVCCSHISQV
ncbi:24-hydroxycholesterol 7-alpha-hydroxylase isoform X2 [Carcharodon carcharias]|uniref:24-hydroxycholesterol 7-alpha-hydroxylase isoform X2 n=1 Tax=Carcharodon carcharias TaxID=13397 RepID=UPI001B7DA69A|nr:24-hydroxycholesterol 7-alpha-hydroxylase isoform X2 [Carcharodon carcharias]